MWYTVHPWLSISLIGNFMSRNIFLRPKNFIILAVPMLTRKSWAAPESVMMFFRTWCIVLGFLVLLENIDGVTYKEERKRCTSFCRSELKGKIYKSEQNCTCGIISKYGFVMRWSACRECCLGKCILTSTLKIIIRIWPRIL